jgi:transposase
VVLCQNLGLFTEAVVAIDGSKFKAVNNRDRNFTQAKLERRMQEIETSINRYLSALDTADRQEPKAAQAKAARLNDKIAALKEQMRSLKEIEGQLEAAPDKQISLTDPDARSMKTRGTGIVGYNVQAAVDAKHHLIVAHEVINTGSDRDQLYPMGTLTKEEMDVEKLTALSDRGYYNREQILACEQAGIEVIVPKNVTSNAAADGRFDKADFIYDPRRDEYRCPAGQALIWRYSSVELGQTLHRYWSSQCQQCPLKAQCTPSKNRRVTRWDHESVLDRVEERLDQTPDAMRIRRQTVEHTFGTIKAWMGWTHFLTRTLPKVSTEMSQHVLAYNMKRLLNILGFDGLMYAIRA